MSGKSKTVLIVEDEAVLRSSMMAGLARIPGVSVLGAGTLREGVAFLDGYPPDVVLCDIDLPDGLGVQIIGELAKRGISPPVVFVTAYRAAYGSLIPPHAGVTVLEKPVSLDELRSAVTSRLGAEPPSSPFTVADYVQLSCMGRHSVIIDIEWGEHSGRVQIVNGDIWSAVDPLGQGEEAFRRVAFKRDAKITCYGSEADPGARNIDQPWESVLMESARLLDEGNRGEPEADLSFGETLFASSIPAPPSPRTPPPPAKPALERTTTLPSMQSPVAPVGRESPPPAPGDTEFANHYDRAISALMRKDYQAAVAAFDLARALRPDDATVNANLARLEAMGHRKKD